MLREVVKTADSHCIRTIVSEICLIVEDNCKLFTCLKFVEYLVNVGEI